eukprot:gnl/MRDRNA2_/MRDRNA2_31775_c0_seq2.p1 gnl/MRDRNA2_/MRDRNA2_31775_c0~~gnl/MRDRNA2_/MRDRNA2_31775_c0_seq2.p1  ORF type:complete len:562 (-),score=85.39 gnl/MRDRNA2_/MRDRNA2_31775_c0_seq2:47-1732(-)
MKFVEALAIISYSASSLNVDGAKPELRLDAVFSFLSASTGGNLPSNSIQALSARDDVNGRRMPPVGDGATPEKERYGTGRSSKDYDQMGVFSAPVSSAMYCIMALTAQYFGVYTILAIYRSLSHFTGQRGESSIQAVLESATFTVSYAPMLAVLFLACRIRALQLTGFHGEPPFFVRKCMVLATCAVFIQLMLVLLLPCLTREVAEVDEDSSLVGSTAQFQSLSISRLRWIAIIVEIVRYLTVIALYGGAGGVCIGIVTMSGSPEIWGAEGAPPVSAAVACTVNLTVQYFVIHLMLCLVRTFRDVVIRVDSEKFMITRPTKFEQILKLASYSVVFAPMLCVLFLLARMRALQLDPHNGAPQVWAQACFYLTTYAVLCQTILILVIPMLPGGDARRGTAEGDIEFRLPSGPISWILIFARHRIEVFLWTLESTRVTVQFAPMLAVLMVGLRLRALQHTDQKGAPQGWAQDAMYLCTGALLFQIIVCVAVATATGEAPEVDEDGNIKEGQIRFKALAIALHVLRYLALLALYGGAVTICVAAFVLTPETANGKGGFLTGGSRA